MQHVQHQIQCKYPQMPQDSKALPWRHYAECASLYFLWWQNDACRVSKNIKPWGLGMFSGDVVDSLDEVLEDIFLVASAQERGRGTKVEQELRLLRQAITGAFLYKELPRWIGRENRTRIHSRQVLRPPIVLW